MYIMWRIDENTSTTAKYQTKLNREAGEPKALAKTNKQYVTPVAKLGPYRPDFAI